MLTRKHYGLPLWGWGVILMIIATGIQWSFHAKAGIKAQHTPDDKGTFQSWFPSVPFGGGSIGFLERPTSNANAHRVVTNPYTPADIPNGEQHG